MGQTRREKRKQKKITWRSLHTKKTQIYQFEKGPNFS